MVKCSGCGVHYRYEDGPTIYICNRCAERRERQAHKAIGFPELMSKVANEMIQEDIELSKTIQTDPINPSHYTSGTIECIDAIRAHFSQEEYRGFLRGNSFKYRWRYRQKNGVEDLKKAEWYEKKLLELESE